MSRYNKETPAQKKAAAQNVLKYLRQQKRIENGTIDPKETLLPDPRKGKPMALPPAKTFTTAEEINSISKMPQAKVQTEKQKSERRRKLVRKSDLPADQSSASSSASSSGASRKRKQEEPDDDDDEEPPFKRQRRRGGDKNIAIQNNQIVAASPVPSNSTNTESIKEPILAASPVSSNTSDTEVSKERWRDTANEAHLSQAQRAQNKAQRKDDRSRRSTSTPKSKSPPESSRSKYNGFADRKKAASPGRRVQEARVEKQKAQPGSTAKTQGHGRRQASPDEPIRKTSAESRATLQNRRLNTPSPTNNASKKPKGIPRSDSVKKPSVETTKDTPKSQSKAPAPPSQPKVVPMKTAGVPNPRLHLTQILSGRDDQGSFRLPSALPRTKMNPDGSFSFGKITYKLEDKKQRIRKHISVFDAATGEYIGKAPAQKQGSPADGDESSL